MKFIPDEVLEFESSLGHKIFLNATLILLEESAQLIVCDQANAFTNLTCTMNMYQDVSYILNLIPTLAEANILN